MIRGSCLCGAVRFEAEKVRSLTHCHCANCRKLTGAAFASYAHVDADKFRFVAGEDMTVRYESAPGSFRNRCKVCGRSRAYYRDFELCRICLRMFALRGELPGVIKASW